MPTYRVITRLPWTSGLPEDVSVNVWHFLADDLTAGLAALTALTTFYNDVDVVLSTLLNQTTNAAEHKMYDLAQPEPRAPIATALFTITAGGAPMAPELAACVSFQAAQASGSPQARRRGRIYLGPLQQGVLDASTGRIDSTDQGTIRTAANTLLDASQAAATWDWAVYSRVDATARAVANGWVDNEWDIQRRRGRRPSSRVTFT